MVFSDIENGINQFFHANMQGHGKQRDNYFACTNI